MPATKKARKKHTQRRPAVIRPRVDEIRRAFHPLDDLLAEMLTGEVVFDHRDLMQMRGSDAAEQWYVARPALMGWLAFWEEATRRIGKYVDLDPFRALINSIGEVEKDPAASVDKQLIQDAIVLQNTLRTIYANMDVYLAHECVFIVKQREAQQERGKEIANMEQAIKTELVSTENGFQDYNVTGLRCVRRATTGKKMKKGDIFNIYCVNGFKFGGEWNGDLESSLLAFATGNEAYLQMIADGATEFEEISTGGGFTALYMPITVADRTGHVLVTNNDDQVPTAPETDEMTIGAYVDGVETDNTQYITLTGKLGLTAWLAQHHHYPDMELTPVMQLLEMAATKLYEQAVADQSEIAEENT